MVCRTLLAFGLALIVGASARAQPVPVTDQEMAMQPFPPPGYPPNSVGPVGPPGPDYSQPLPAYPNPICEPPWCPSPYKNSAWRVEVDLIPTISHVSEMAFGDWSNNGSLALRLNLGYEDCDGFGTRAEFWGVAEEADTLVGQVDLTASTFYLDFYKRFFIEQAELVLGGGVAGAGMEYDMKDLNERARLNAGGISIFGEGFYPLWRFAKTDVGSVGRVRLALLTGQWNDRGTPFVDDTNNDVMSIMELAWGLEIRRRFGRLEDKYWYIDIVPEFQRWESSSLPSEFNPGFEGTAINFGLAW